MPRKSKNEFSVNGDTVWITREEWPSVAMATYREDYYEELSSHTWGLKNDYPNNDTLGGGLHRYMMAKWYTEEELRAFTEKGYVVDHMNNNHMDCRISNLKFLTHDRNVAKGQYLDKESKKMRHRLAVSIFKDFTTGFYQMTIGCNDCIAINDEAGKPHYINSIQLLYDCNYALVILDAEALLTQYAEEERFSLQHFRFKDIKVNEAPDIQLTEEEKEQAFVMREGKMYLVIGNGKTFLDTVHYQAGWRPKDE